MKTKLPLYFSKIIKEYPNIVSGRKNFKENHKRIIKTKTLIKDYIIKKNKPK
tara:strand:+ start:427 stop:582 length:156 start_codon:yes stop_codon:yes gene_type:complete